VKVVFVHPSYPNQFTAIAHRLGAQPGWECACLVDARFTEAVRHDAPPIAYYGYHGGTTAASGNDCAQSLADGMQCGKAVVEALAHLQATEGVDVVVGHAAFGTTFFVRDLLDLPVIAYVELPGYYPLYARAEFPPQDGQRLLDVSLRASIYTSVLRADVGIVPSRYAKRLFPPELQPKLRVQMEGFALPAPVRDRVRSRHELGLPGTGPIIGFAARTLEAVRGFDVFVKIATKVRRVRPDVQCVVIGDEATLYGNELLYLGGQSFKHHVLTAEGVGAQAYIFRPFMPYERFIKHLQVMDVGLFPIFEGAANWGLFEAMAAGVPMLAARRCFIPEVITHDRDGWLFEPTDIDGFSEAALRVLEEPERLRSVGSAARRTIARRFALAQAVKGYRAIIGGAVNRHRRTRPIPPHPNPLPHGGRGKRRNTSRSQLGERAG
jgi:glycosyltransferase involved in cell wall biosynthesis